MGRLLIFFFIALFFSSCENGVPKGVIPEEKMVAVLTDLHIANAYVSDSYGDSAKKDAELVFKAFYKKHSVDSTQVKKSLHYYARNPEVLDVMYAKVDANLTAIEKKETARRLKLQKAAQKKKMKKVGKEKSLSALDTITSKKKKVLRK